MRKHALRAPRLMGVLLTVLPTAQCSAKAMRKHALRAPRLLGVLLTVLPTAQCSANAGDIVTHHVPYWTDDYGYCKKLPGLDEGVHRRFGLERLHVKKGDRIAFTYSTHHDIWAHPTLEALESCDFSTATRIANTTEGGGCADEADLACMSAATPFILRPNTPGMLYLSCHVSDHCANGQRLVVQVHSSRPQPPAEVLALAVDAQHILSHARSARTIRRAAHACSTCGASPVARR